VNTDPTPFTELVGCRLPLQLAGMPRTSVPDLVVAVADAGGLGMLGGARATAAQLERDLGKISRRTDGAIGVTFLAPFMDPEAVEIASRRARVVEVFWGPPDPGLVARIHAGGALASWQVGSVDDARAAERAGCDIVVVQGVEAGGHVRGTTPLADLLAAARTAVRVPVVAAGGIGTRRDVAAALAAGAHAVRCGTIFVAASESGAHPGYQRALVDADPSDAVLTTAFSHGWPDAPHRVLRDCIRALAHAPDPVGELIDDDARITLVRGGTPSPTRSTRGTIAAMPLYAGLSVGAVQAIRPAATIIADLIGTVE
jgi:nitronate monooxygenase